MNLPNFFLAAPRITVRDPLSAFLGAADGGVLEYGYADAVKLAGHSCPTVAGAYLICVRALRRLYGRAMPVRGEISVHLREQPDEGVAGVMAGVATLLTGAAGETGFKGIGGRFDRRGLLTFGEDIRGIMAFRRRDNGAGVLAFLDTGVIPADPAAHDLLRRQIVGAADATEAARFRALWQDRVRRMLVDHADDDRLIRLEDWPIPEGKA